MATTYNQIENLNIEEGKELNITDNSQHQRTFGREITNFSQFQNYGLDNEKKINQKSQSCLNINPSRNVLTESQQQQALLDLDNIDRKDQKMPSLISNYSKQIFDYLKAREAHYQVTDYILHQKDINEKMRAILVDWLVSVHQKYRMVPETLFMAVNLMDMFLEHNQISRQKLQLVGITSMFIAAKYEEIYPPHLKEFQEVTDKAYSKSEILDMEAQIIKYVELKFLTMPSTLRFLDRYTGILQSDQRIYYLCLYLIELALMDYRCIKYSPSNIACSAIYLSNKIYKKPQCWSDPLTLQSQYCENDIKLVAKELCLILQNAPQSNLQAIRKKYSHSKYLEISKIQLEKISQ